MRLLSSLDREPLAAQFVPVKIETGNNEHWQVWARKYKYDGDAIPIVYVVRADGQQLYGQSGMPAPLTQFLALQLRQAGRMLNPRELSQLAEDAAAAQKLIEDEQLQEAIELVSRSAGSGSYAEAPVAIDKLAAELSRQGQDALAAAGEQLEEKDKAFEGALAFAAVERVYGKLSAVDQALRELRAKHRKDREIRGLLEQAAVIDKARAAEADEDFREAFSAYRAVLSRFPDMPAAKLAADAISKLEAAGVTANATPRRAESSIGDDRRAAAQLKMAKVILKRNREKAGEYLRKVIELAPGSEAAAEARELLEKP